eukprot:CAMPEP_0175134858 /NCGR_PEP_ID=MMETSP0087-20121206/8404_1 /TAXON_ID=136419 /ORGANISM="Unknown Unknown, Strain D1" /LENGTH=915 /DNA_ID=CAMNT_0016417451 /DNA_START=180 /DNA_END=2925 /DNA_ORIENTATION=-
MKEVHIDIKDKKGKEKALAEVRTMELLKHPYIVAVVDSFTKGSVLYIVMEYAGGGDMEQRMNSLKDKLFDEAQIQCWLVQICLALEHVHDHKILHRDIKTPNIFLTEEDKVKVGDFGVARSLSHTKEQANTTIGTPFYLSPEMCKSESYNLKSDVWSLGVVMYELMQKKRPFDGANILSLVMQICEAPAPPLPTQYSQNLRNLVMAMLTKDPHTRPSIKQILQETWLEGIVKKYRKGIHPETLSMQTMREKAKVCAACSKALPDFRTTISTLRETKEGLAGALGIKLNGKWFHSRCVSCKGCKKAYADHLCFEFSKVKGEKGQAPFCKPCRLKLGQAESGDWSCAECGTFNERTDLACAGCRMEKNWRLSDEADAHGFIYSSEERKDLDDTAEINKFLRTVSFGDTQTSELDLSLDPRGDPDHLERMKSAYGDLGKEEGQGGQGASQKGNEQAKRRAPPPKQQPRGGAERNGERGGEGRRAPPPRKASERPPPPPRNKDRGRGEGSREDRDRDRDSRDNRGSLDKRERGGERGERAKHKPDKPGPAPPNAQAPSEAERDPWDDPSLTPKQKMKLRKQYQADRRGAELIQQGKQEFFSAKAKATANKHHDFRGTADVLPAPRAAAGGNLRPVIPPRTPPSRGGGGGSSSLFNEPASAYPAPKTPDHLGPIRNVPSPKSPSGRYRNSQSPSQLRLQNSRSPGGFDQPHTPAGSYERQSEFLAPSPRSRRSRLSPSHGTDSPTHSPSAAFAVHPPHSDSPRHFNHSPNQRVSRHSPQPPSPSFARSSSNDWNGEPQRSPNRWRGDEHRDSYNRDRPPPPRNRDPRPPSGSPSSNFDYDDPMEQPLPGNRGRSVDSDDYRPSQGPSRSRGPRNVDEDPMERPLQAPDREVREGVAEHADTSLVVNVLLWLQKFINATCW